MKTSGPGSFMIRMKAQRQERLLQKIIDDPHVNIPDLWVWFKAEYPTFTKQRFSDDLIDLVEQRKITLSSAQAYPE